MTTRAAWAGDGRLYRCGLAMGQEDKLHPPAPFLPRTSLCSAVEAPPPLPGRVVGPMVLGSHRSAAPRGRLALCRRPPVATTPAADGGRPRGSAAAASSQSRPPAPVLPSYVLNLAGRHTVHTRPPDNAPDGHNGAQLRITVRAAEAEEYKATSEERPLFALYRPLASYLPCTTRPLLGRLLNILLVAAPSPPP